MEQEFKPGDLVRLKVDHSVKYVVIQVDEQRINVKCRDKENKEVLVPYVTLEMDSFTNPIYLG